MKKNYFKLFSLVFFVVYLRSVSTSAAQTLNLDVADQNFNSTDKIIINQDEIQKSRITNLPALLATKANISISTTNMQPNSIYIRGGDSSHVLILIDGVPTYDASSPQRTINLFNLNLSKIKKIEILKGSQSVLYGGQAMSGVIKIETFSEGQKNETALLGDVAVSRRSGAKQTLALDNIYNISDSVSLSGSIYGMNAQNNSPVQGSDVLYPEKTVAVDTTVKFKSEFENILKLNYSKDDNQITDVYLSNSKAVDTEDFKAATETLGLSWVLKKSDRFNLVSSIQKINRSLDQLKDKTLSGFVTDEKYEGILSNLRLDSNIFKNENTHLNTGFQLSTESMKYKSDQIIKIDDRTQYEGLYLKSDYKFQNDILVEAGLRQETSKLKSLATTYQVGVVWNQTVFLEYSTGFKTPSLFQLYSSYGNVDLKPELSKNISLSFEHQFSSNLFTSLTYFDSQFEDLIDFSYALSKYNNIKKTRTVGLESLTSLNYFDGLLRLTLSLGYQEPRDISRDQWLVRRPLHTGSFRISSDVAAYLNLGSEIIYSGEKLDKSGTSYLTVPDYSLINIFANYNLINQATLFARIENIENIEYQTTYGFYNSGTNYKIGFQYNF